MSVTEPVSRFSETEIRALHQEYQRGATLSYLADQEGVTRETIRLLFRRYGLPTRTPGQAAALNAEYRAQLAEESRGEIQRLYMLYGTIDDVAAELELPRKIVAGIVAEIPNRESYRRTGERSVYTREELIAHLRRAAAVKGDPLGIPAYREAARELRLANYDTQVRFFSLEDPENPWLAALAAAGIQGHAPLGRRPDSFSPQDCIDAVVRCLREHPEGISYALYSKWAKVNVGPSGPSVRKIVGWSAALEQAYEQLDQDG